MTVKRGHGAEMASRLRPTPHSPSSGSDGNHPYAHGPELAAGAASEVAEWTGLVVKAVRQCGSCCTLREPYGWVLRAKFRMLLARRRVDAPPWSLKVGPAVRWRFAPSKLSSKERRLGCKVPPSCEPDVGD